MLNDARASVPAPEDAVDRISKALNNRRNELGMTLDQVAVAMDMSIGTVSNLMTGKHTYPAPILALVLRALQWSALQLAFEVERPQGEDSPALQKIAKLMAQAVEARRLPSRPPSGS